VKEYRLAGILALALIGLCATDIAQAQAWDTNLISITPPTTCTTGEPVSACPVTGYRIERSATQTGTYTAVTTLPPTQLIYSHTGVTAGPNCYRVIATSALGDSTFNVRCRTNTRPVGPPNAPEFTVTSPTAFNIRADFQHFAFVKSTRWGTANIGAACDESRCIGEYCVVTSRRSLNPRPPEGEYKVAKCG
jgi:hypothetical protein